MTVCKLTELPSITIKKWMWMSKLHREIVKNKLKKTIFLYFKPDIFLINIHYFNMKKIYIYLSLF